MKIEVLPQKYKIGCQRGMNYLEKPGLLSKLNMIIEWPKCSFPHVPDHDEERETGEVDDEGNPITQTIHVFKEDRTFLGDDPELKPGNCFKLGGQLIAVDSDDRLVLMVSETGTYALQRLWEEKILPEIEMIFNDYDTDDVEMEDVAPEDVPGDLESAKVEWKYWDIWRKQFTRIEKQKVQAPAADLDGIPEELKKILQQAQKNGTKIIGAGAGEIDLGADDEKEIEVEVSDYRPKKCILHSDDLVVPMTIYMMEHNFMYSPEDMDEEMAKEAVMHIISWTVDTNRQY